MDSKWTTVFSFVFRHHACSPGYRNATIIVTILLLILIPAVFCIAAGMSTDDGNGENSIKRAIVVNKDGALVPAVCAGVETETAEDIESAVTAVVGDKNTVIIDISENAINVLIPDGSAVSREDAQALGSVLNIINTAGIQCDVDTGAQAELPEDVPIDEAADEDAGDSEMREIVGMLVPYVTVMLIYFMVLIYSQGVANAVIMEKTSKLMDLFLVSVKPASVMLGKTLAVALAGIIQLVMWLAGAGAGVAMGNALAGKMYPHVQLGLSAFFDSLGGLASVFDPFMILVTVAMIVAGFLLYCSLSALGGALASRPEELSSTNSLFSMALVISFLLCIFSGTGGGEIAGDRWMNFVPFTAILVVPGRLIMGDIAPVEALLSVVITAISAYILLLLAGKAYTMTAFYRGAPIKPIKFFRTLIKKQA